MMQRFLTTALLSVLLTITALADKPNIVLIMADDLGYGDLGCYGSELNETPHIDALAEDGLRFTDFHSSGPMCTPTRAAMLTGLYQQRFGKRFDNAISGVKDHDSGLPHEAFTIAELLKTEGYATACFGKWHLGYQPPWLPTSQGFDVFRGLGSGDGDHHTQIDRSGREDWWHNNEIAMESGYTTDLLTRYSVEFIEDNKEQPFFLYVPHLAIHFPWQGPEDPPHRVKGTNYMKDKWGIIPDPGNVAPHVKGMVESLDASVGGIMAALEEQGIRQNTLVIFTSDNGGYLTYGANFKNISSNGPLRGQKTQVYEGGHRVPTIFSWPGRIDAGVTAELGHSTDIFPTIAQLTGAKTEGLLLDGQDLTKLLFEGESLPDRSLFWRCNSGTAVRSGPWKLCVTDGKTQLYNLTDDLGETKNLADQKPELTDQLQRAWKDWETEVNRSAETYAQP